MNNYSQYVEIKRVCFNKIVSDCKLRGLQEGASPLLHIRSSFDLLAMVNNKYPTPTC